MWPILALLAFSGLLVVTFAWQRQVRRLHAEISALESRIRESEARHRLDLERELGRRELIFDRMIEGLVVLDSGSRVQMLNQAARRLFGLGSDTHGRTLLEVLRRHELQELADRARLQGQALGLDLVLDGPPTCSLEVNATAFKDPDGTSGGVILVFHDVTRLEELETTRREFVANVSHELRTPITIIKGFVETLLDGARNEPALCLKFLQTVEKHANRLTFLIEDLLTISQLEEGKTLVNRQWGSVHDIAVRVLDDFAARARARQITLVDSTPADLALRADLDRLQQVLVNLVDNAIKYGRAGGQVVVSARVSANGRQLEITVSDDGPGIPDEALPRIFERFYRVDTARSRDQGGTGLGLSIVKHIVQAHGGDVHAESTLGKGTVFRLVFPWEPPPATVS